MRRGAMLLGALGVLWAGAAQATGSIDCDAVEAPDVSLSILVSRLVDPMVSQLGAEFSINGVRYSTTPGEAGSAAGDTIPLAPLHQYGDAHTMIVEYADDQLTEILVSLRLVQGAAGDGHAIAGVLTVKDVGAWAVTCLLG